MYEIRAGKRAPIILQAFDAFNNPAPVENAQFLLNDAVGGRLAIIDESGVPFLTTLGPATQGDETIQLAVDVDARIGDGEVLLHGTEDIKVSAAEANRVVVSFGAAEDIPA